MPLVADRVAETTTTTGTGTVTLAGAKAGYQAFTTAFTTGAKVYYCITDNTDWEVGVGTFTTAGTTLSRDSVFASSNAGAAVNWGAGSKDVFCTAPTQTIVGAPIFKNKTGAYTVVASDNGTIINCTSGTFTVSLTAAATLGAGFNFWIWNTGTGTITIDPNGSETVDQLSTYTLSRQRILRLVCTGSAWVSVADNAARSIASNIDYAPPVATSLNSTAIGATSAGDRSQAVTGAGAMALGGSYASGTDSFAAAVANNTSSYGATGSNSIAIGQQNKSSSNVTVTIGGAQNTASAFYALVLSGAQNTASGNYSVVIGGNQSSATGAGSFALGRNCVSSISGKYAYASQSFAANGDAQTGTFVLRRATTDATPTVLTTDNSAPGTDDQIILPNNSAYAFTGIIVARQQASGGTASAAWKIEGLIRREGSAGTTTLVASTVTAIDNTPGWTLALSADTTNGGLKIEATGAAATNIRWVAQVTTAEVTYA